MNVYPSTAAERAFVNGALNSQQKSAGKHPMARAVQEQREEAAKAADMVNQPSHYSRFVIEPATFAMANKLNGLELNVVKYTLRAPYKGVPVQDYNKAIRCLEMLIETHKREARIADGESAQDVWKVTL